LKGDSGGPLLAGDVLLGVISYIFKGTDCGQADIPGIYSRVTYYLDWINENQDNSIARKASSPERETIGNEAKRVITEPKPYIWWGNSGLPNYYLGFPMSYGFNTVPNLSPLSRTSYQTFNPAYGPRFQSINV